jgi:hypothetical protein
MFFPLLKEVIVFIRWGMMRYLDLICKCLLNDKYIKLTCIMILYEEITHAYRKTHVTVV